MWKNSVSSPSLFPRGDMAENPKRLFLCLVFGTRNKAHSYANGGHRSHMPGITMTPDPQESQGFRTSVLGMGLREDQTSSPQHTKRKSWKLQEKNIWSLTKEAAVRVGADSQRTNEGQKGARQHTQSAAWKHWETRVLSPTKPSLRAWNEGFPNKQIWENLLLPDLSYRKH